MNFKTTIILIITLAMVGAVLFFTRDHTTETSEPTPVPEKKLLDIASADVTKLKITPADGKAIALEKSGTDWVMTAPLSTPADADTVGLLVDSLTGFQSRGTIDPTGQNASATGLDQPSFRIELTTKDGKAEKLLVGNKSATGGNLYVQREGNKQADLVPSDIYDQLDKPAAAMRDMRLVHVNSPEIYQLQITSPKGKVELNKSGPNWTIAGPTTMPADATEITDVLSALTGLRASEFVREEPGTSNDAKIYGLDAPVVTVSYSAQPATTQPTTQPAITGSVKLGRYDDVLKKNVYIASSITPAIAKAPAMLLETFQKTALDLREKKVLSVDPEKVLDFAIAIDKPATAQPTSRPAVNATIRVARHHEEKSASQPAATQATTDASSQPAAATVSEPRAKWELTSDPKGLADDVAVDSLLTMLNPLRAEKFIEASATTQPVDRYVLTILIAGAASPIEVTVTDRGQGQSPIASYNGTSFEVSRALIDRLEGRFAKQSLPKPAMP